MDSTFLLYICHFGTGLALMMAAVEFFRQDRNESGNSLVLIGLCVFSGQLRLGMYVSGVFFETPSFVFLFATTVFLVGPLIARHAVVMTGGGLPFLSRVVWWPFYLPAGLAFCGEVYFMLQETANQKKMLLESLTIFQADFINLGLIAGGIYITYFFIQIEIDSARMVKKYKLQLNRWLRLLVPLPPLASAFCLLGFLLKSDALFYAGTTLITILLSYLQIFMARYPGFVDSVRIEVRKQKYATTMLNQVDVGAVKARLVELLEEDELYLNDSLRVSDVAEELLITKNQLSRIINEEYGLNFNDYINVHRINLAKKLLTESPELSVIGIAFQVGFNSKSTFNAVFKKMEGKSPSEFRAKV